MSRWDWTVRCARVERDAVEAEAARLVADLPSDDELSVAHAEGPPALAEVRVRDGGFPAAEVARRLGGLVWFTRDAVDDREIAVRALYLDGQLVFEVMLCELFDCDELEVGPAFVDDLEPTLADLLEPSTWAMRVAAERFGEAFTRISSHLEIRADERRTIAGTGPVREVGGDEEADRADDDIPF